MKYLAVAIAGFVLGGWAVPLGFVLGLGPLATFVASAAGGLVGCWVFLFCGEWIERLLRDRRGQSAAEAAGRSADDENVKQRAKIERFVDKFGVRGLGLMGPIFPGVTASVLGGLALGIDRRELGRWMTIGIIVMYGLYTVGLSLLV